MDGVKINLSLNEIYKVLCPKCQKKLKDLVKDKLSDQMVEEALAGKAENES
jgi:hypothetical protein